ncbi:hypothetical protein Y032_0211g2212 [Ancylostoma ceylanicum]|nr:hypothetical protein Y032_0211g2212 [Ancylostoma ceylanicum]
MSHDEAKWGDIFPPFGVNSSPFTFKFAWASMVESRTHCPSTFASPSGMCGSEISNPVKRKTEGQKWAETGKR